MSKNIHATQDWVRDNLGIKPTASGELISLSDSAEQPLQSMKIFGKTTQFTTTGKNLFGGTALRDKILSSIPSATIDETNETIEYNSKNSRFVEFVELSFKENTRYTIVLSGLNTGELYDYCNMLIYYTDGSTQQMRFGAIKTHVKVAIVTESKKTVQKICGQYASDSTILYYNECGIFEGVRTLDDFEPYTGGIPSPNPNYPQELVSVGDGGSTTEYVMGKNLLPYPYVNTTKTTNGITYKDNGDGSVSVSGTSTGSYAEMILMSSTSHVPFVAGKTYKLINNDESISLLMSYLNEEGKIRYMTATANGTTFTWKDEYTFRNIYLSIAGAGKTVSGTVKPMLCTADTSDNIWEPYKEQSLTISTPNGLPGIPVSSGGNYTDSNGQQYVCDYKDHERNVYVQRVVKIICDGSADEQWSDSNDVGAKNRYFMLTIGELYYAIDNACLCTHYKQTSIGSSSDVIGFNVFNSVAYNRAHISVRPNNYIDMTIKEFRNLLAENPITVYYALTTPIETPLTEEEIQAYKALHTNYPNTTIYNDEGAGAEVEYVADTKNYIDNKIEKSVAELTAAILSTGGNI